MNPPAPASEHEKHYIVLIHGIRTQAAWAEMVASVLEEQKTVTVRPIRYGFFNILRFLCPFLTRTGPVRRVLRELRDIRVRDKTARISVIAHSFGTYAIARALEHTDIEINQLVFCGSIVDENFDPSKHKGQIKTEYILNDCGTKDALPVLATSCTWGYGATGTFGFGTNAIKDRFHDFSHSEYFNEDFVRNYWAPYFWRGEITPSPIDRNRATPPYWQSLLTVVKLRWLLFVLPVLWGAWGAYSTYVNWPTPKLFLKDRTVRVGHWIGSPHVVLGVKQIHLSTLPQTIRLTALELEGPKGLKYEIPFEGGLVEDTKASCEKQYVHKAVSFWTIQWPGYYEHNLSFLLQDDDTRLALVQAAGAIQGTPCSPDLSKPLLSPEASDYLVRVTRRNWIWTSGEWRFRLRHSVNDAWHDVEGYFTLTEDDIRCLQRSENEYKFGFGVFWSWRNLSSNGVCGLLGKHVD